MCGIVYIKRKDNKSAVKSVKKRYNRQKVRGSDGFGYVAIKNNKVVSYQRAPTEHEIMQKLDKEDAHEILFHHRFPTSTPNMEEQAHPLFVSHESFKNDYYVVHNGVIRNPFLRRQEHVRLGIKYTTDLKPLWQTPSKKVYHANTDLKFNDSEAIATDTALVLEGKATSIESEGAAAVIALQVKDGMIVDRIFYRNNLNPLKVSEDKTMLSITSLGKGEDISPLYLMHLNGDVLEKHPNKVFVPVGYRPYSTPPTKVYGVPDYTRDDLDYGYSPGDDEDIAAYFKRQAPLLDIKSSVTPRSKLDGVSPHVIRAMSDDVVWEEYDKSLSTIADLTKGIELLDGKVAAGIINEGITSGRLRLQESLNRTNVYKAQLDAEIGRRIHDNGKIQMSKGGLLTG